VVVAGEELLAGDPAEHAVDERGNEGPGGFLAVEPAAGQDAAEDPPVVSVGSWAHSSGQRRA